MKKTISKDGTEIAFERAGKGPALILVDGALCSMAFGPMPKLAAELSGQFTVIWYDRRGRNLSGNTKPYAVKREIEDLSAVIQEAGGQAFVMGISSGAALALAATASGLPVTGLAMYEPPFFVDQGGHYPPPDAKEKLTQLIDSDRRSDALKYFMHNMIGAPSIFVTLFSLMPVWSKLKAVAHTLPHDAAVMGDFSLPTALAASIKVPTLVAGGAKSPASMRHAAEVLTRAVPGARLAWLPGQKHNVSPSVLAPVLKNFFLGLPSETTKSTSEPGRVESVKPAAQ